MGPRREVVEISSDEDEGPGKLSVSPGPLGWVARLGDSSAPVPRKKKTGKNSSGVRVGKDDDDCVVLDGDPHRLVAAAAGAKGRSAGGGGSDEVEIVAVKGEIACKDFPHSRHVCSEFPFGSTSHVKHCSMCYCFVCDAPAPCKYWGKGLSSDDHCHATDKEARWKTMRQAFTCKNLPASYPPKHANVVYPTTPSPPRQQEYYESMVCVRNLPYDIDSEDLAQLFVYAGNVKSSEIIYDNVTGQSCGYGFVTMSTVQEAEKAVELYHRREMDGIPMTVSKASSTRVAWADQGPSPGRSPFKIYVANIPWKTRNSSLKQHFSEYGEVVSAKVHHHGERLTGFVTMATREASDHAIWYLNNQVWRGRTLRVRVAE